MGFSGAPVFDHSREAVVGIVVMRDDPRTRTGHMLPMSYLRTLWPEVRRNCGWRLDLDASYRTHWRPRARGSEIDSDTSEWFFTGRTEARRVISAWLEERDLAEHPILLVTGGPGSGKSALLAHSLVSADPLLAPTVPTSGPRPPTGAFDVALHLRGRTCGEVTARLAGVLGVAASDPEELLAAVGELPRGERFCVMADAVEEAASLDEARKISTLLRQLANTGRARVLAAVRTAPAGTSRARILNNFGRSAPRIDLENTQYLHRPDIADYVVRRLTSEQADSGPYRTYAPDQLAAIGEAVARKTRYNFLIAQLTTIWLSRRSAPGPGPAGIAWEEELPETVGQVMDAYLDTCGTDAETVRRLLTALAYARGDGLPRGDTWLRIADALGFGVSHTANDLKTIFESAAHYLVERVNEHSGPHTYRLYHDALDQHLREECEHVHHDPEAAITAALIDAVPGCDGQRDWAAADSYIRDHLAAHAATAGRLDALLAADAEYLVHATPRGLTPHLHHALSEQARRNTSVYRTSWDLHRALPSAARRQFLALDAARFRNAPLQTQLPGDSDWQVRWATNSQVSTALVRTLTGHTGGVRAVSVAELEGRPHAITGGSDGAVRVWDLTTGTQIRELTGHTGSVHAVSVAELEGRPHAITGGSDGAVRVWDLTSGTQTHHLTGQKPSHTSWVSAVAMVKLEGRPHAIFCRGSDGSVWVWDLAIRGPARELIGAGQVNAVEVTQLEGRPHAVTGNADRSVRVWDLTSGTQTRHQTGHTDRVHAVAVVELGGRPHAVTGSYDKSVRVLDLTTGAQTCHLTGHTDWVSAVAVVELGGRPHAVTGSYDKSVRVWDLTTGTQTYELAGHTDGVSAVAVVELGGRPHAVTGSGDRPYGATGSGERPVRVWDLTTDIQTYELTGHTNWVSAVAVAEVQGRPYAVTGSGDRSVRVWDLTTDTLTYELTGHTAPVRAVEVVELEGRPHAVTGGDDGSVRVWDLTTGTQTRHLTRRPGVSALAVVKLGGRPYVVTGSYNGYLRVWDLATTAQPRHLTGHTGSVHAVAVMELEGRPHAVTGSSDGSVRVWDVTTGTQTYELIGRNGRVWAVEVVELEGRPHAVIASDDGSVRVWDVTTGAQPRELTGHSDGVRTVAVVELEGRPYAVTGSDDRSVRVWDLTTGSCLTTLHCPASVLAVAVTTDATVVVGFGHEVAVLSCVPLQRRSR
ncbi:hypothetical protein [Streptomyces sp. NBC_01546]|uniref:hypothetical protein n=1 Tax=Streptomyces sp. NBC_01546 TaxID=2975872 RepID=UPI00386D684D